MRTIEEGEYLIPNGYSVKRVGDKLTVYKSKRNVLKVGEYRCKDCKHYVKGFSTNSGWYETMVCEENPKRITNDGRYTYKAVQKYGMPCYKFEWKGCKE